MVVEQTEIYEGKAVDITYVESGKDREYETFDIMISGYITLHVDRDVFNELYNAMIVSKQKLKEIEENK